MERNGPCGRAAVAVAPRVAVETRLRPPVGGLGGEVVEYVGRGDVDGVADAHPEVHTQPCSGEQEGDGVQDAAAAGDDAHPPGRDPVGPGYEARHQAVTRSEETGGVRPEE